MKQNIFLIMILFILHSCNTKENFKEELSHDQIIQSGPWRSFSDSLSGLAISGKQMAFYHNETFSDDDMCRYEIVDSVLYKNKNRIIMSTYLKSKGYRDTIYYKITNRSNSDISLTLKSGQTENFRLKIK